MGKTSINGSFSIAMFVYQSVNVASNIRPKDFDELVLWQRQIWVTPLPIKIKNLPGTLKEIHRLVYIYNITDIHI